MTGIDTEETEGKGADLYYLAHYHTVIITSIIQALMTGIDTEETEGEGALDGNVNNKDTTSKTDLPFKDVVADNK